LTLRIPCDTDALCGQKTVHIVTATGDICYWALQGNCHLSSLWKDFWE